MSYQIPPLAKHFIGGEFVPSRSARTFDTLNPATGEKICPVAMGDADDVAVAVSAAEAAWPHWSAKSVQERCTLLKRVGEAILKHKEELAWLESLDTGKPIGETLGGDIPRSALNFNFFGDLAPHQSAGTHVDDQGTIHTSFRESLGVVGLITPWNLPLYLATWKIAPALAQGNTVLLKPAELTPLSAHRLAEIFNEVGIPPGVFNVVQGFGAGGAGEALVSHPRVRAISFTGETTTGSAIMQASAKSLKKLSFELGGKGATVVCADANLAFAASRAVAAAFRNQGQICLAGSRLLVHESIKEEMQALVCSEIKKIKIGSPQDSATNMGALISREHRDKVLGYIEHAKKSGYPILCGGEVPAAFSKGAYLAPTLISDVPQSDPLIQEEVFGPVLTLQTFGSIEQAVDMVNGTSYGLSCSVFSLNIDQAYRFARGVRMGLVWINDWFLRDLHTAFGGMKRSGVGREGGQHSLDFFSEFKTVSVRLS